MVLGRGAIPRHIMRKFTTLFFAVSLGAMLGACDVEPVEGEPTVVELRAKPKTPCGGFAGLTCPDGQTCVDDPSDDCDPDNGGADCVGMCVNGNPGGGKRGGSNSCNHHDDPSKAYIGTSLEECAVIHFICSEGSHYFADDCGCGCEVDA